MADVFPPQTADWYSETKRHVLSAWIHQIGDEHRTIIKQKEAEMKRLRETRNASNQRVVQLKNTNATLKKEKKQLSDTLERERQEMAEMRQQHKRDSLRNETAVRQQIERVSTKHMAYTAEQLSLNECLRLELADAQKEIAALKQDLDAAHHDMLQPVHTTRDMYCRQFTGTATHWSETNGLMISPPIEESQSVCLYAVPCLCMCLARSIG